MKKSMLLILLLTLIFTFSACGDNSAPISSETLQTETSQPESAIESEVESNNETSSKADVENESEDQTSAESSSQPEQQSSLPSSTQTESDKHTHNFGAWKSVKDATCTKGGKEERVCKCGEKETRTTKALGHTEVVDAAIKATCTTEGKTEGKHCSVCNKVIKKQKSIEKLEHTEVIIPRIEPTCTTKGMSKGRYCSVCNEVFKAPKELETTEHDFGEWSVVKYATATKEGVREHTCTVCDTTVTDVIKPMKNTGSKHGSAAYFSETTVIVSIFADDKNTSWDFESEKDKSTLNIMYDHLCSAGYWLEAQGENYGVNTKFICDWKENPDLFYTADFTEDDMITKYGTFLPKQRKFIESNIDSNELMQKYNAQNILYMVYFDVPETNTVSSWCSFKSPNNTSYNMEIINIFNRQCYDTNNGLYYYTPAATFAHETLHAFGAPDLYYKNNRIPQEYVDYCNQIKSSDIMFTINIGKSISVHFSELCAYYVGLKDSAADVEQWKLAESHFVGE